MEDQKGEFHNIEKEGDDQGCFDLSHKMKMLVTILLLVVSIIMTYVSLTQYPKARVGFFFIYIIGTALGVFATIILRVPRKQFQFIKSSPVYMVIVIVFAAFVIVNVLFGCAGHNAAWLLAIFITLQLAINLFYSYALIPDGFSGLKTALI